MKHLSTKTYGHNIGLSCAFRQWRADSHCRLLHGYALAFKFTFEADELDARNWVVDFGSMKSLKGTLERTFDHTTIVAEDDPELDWFKEAEARGILRLIVLPAGGCEKFAEYVFGVTEIWLTDNGYSPRVKLRSVEVMEHGANSAMAEAASVSPMFVGTVFPNAGTVPLCQPPTVAQAAMEYSIASPDVNVADVVAAIERAEARYEG